MIAVTVAELKNRLSHYLRLVRAGETVIVRSRDRAIARIETIGDLPASVEGDAWLDELEIRGVIRRGKAGGITIGLLAGRPEVEADGVGAVLRERAEGR